MTGFEFVPELLSVEIRIRAVELIRHESGDVISIEILNANPTNLIASPQPERDAIEAASEAIMWLAVLHREANGTAFRHMDKDRWLLSLGELLRVDECCHVVRNWDGCSWICAFVTRKRRGEEQDGEYEKGRSHVVMGMAPNGQRQTRRRVVGQDERWSCC